MIVRRRHETRSQLHRVTALDPDHPAMLESRTVYPNTVRDASAREWVLKSGDNSVKLGDRIGKGPWRGAALYSLKLEERATCPATCQQWANCYGNHVGRRATRWNVNVALYDRLTVELAVLTKRHRRIAIRLHDLGDFPSVEYVRFWLYQLQRHPGLHVFGFTHHERTSRIGKVIEAESRKWDRFRLRFSDNHRGARTSHVIEDQTAQGRHPLGIVCPADSTRPHVTCGSCAFCITSTKPVVFKAH